MLKGTELTSIGAKQGTATKELLAKKERYVSRGISNLAPIFIESAKGAVVRDLDGNVYLDCYGGIGVINAGHCPDVVIDAIKGQAEKLLHSCFSVSMYDSYVNLAEKLVSLTPGDDLQKTIFVNSGAEAVENAIKIAKLHTQRSGLIAFSGGYHGRTLLTLTLTSKVKPYKAGFGPFAPEVYKAPFAYCYRCPFQSTYPECGLHCLEHFERFFVSEVDSSHIAAMIIEPVQGEGGFVVPPKEFLPGLKAICEKHGIVFIADEIQSGFARTGKMFAIEHFEVIPDLMTLAKSIASGLPLSAVVGQAEIIDAPDPGRIGTTYGGNPVACAAALAALGHIESEDLCGKAVRIGAKITSTMELLKQRYAQLGDVRSLGAMVAVEFVKDPQSKTPDKDAVTKIISTCFRRGLLVIGAGLFGNVIRFLPPLVMTDDQLEQAMGIFSDAIAEVFEE
ncbi:MAG: 4-aminobutyrate--2-oxoglutarate transaminase [Desulfuromusa sp.]|nr:4-aminobutyrate--2-oxoglutarate transaminase [Desulfuromusa sp.]